MDLNQFTLPAIDVARSVQFYRTMGFALIVSTPHYARFQSKVGSSTFSIHAVDEIPNNPSTVIYFECTSLDEQVRELQRLGIRFYQEPRDEPWLWREARLLDPAGNVICLYHAGVNRLNPPWRVHT